MKINFPGIAVLLALLLILPCVSSRKERKAQLKERLLGETNQPIKTPL
jgi:hypothetical protein